MSNGHPANNGSKWITRVRRYAIYSRDDFTCVYCGSSKNLTLDHLRPYIKGGDNKTRNLVTACFSCNSARGDKPWWEYADDSAVQRIRVVRRRSIKTRVKRAKLVLAASSWNDVIAHIIARTRRV